MIYRVQADLAFDTEDEANSFYRACQHALVLASPINPGKQSYEETYIKLQMCRHTQSPPLPCTQVHREVVT